MRNYLVCILTALALTSGCKKESYPSKDVSFLLINQTVADVNGKLFTMRDAEPLDSISFTVSANATRDLVWEDIRASGEGDFQIYLSEELNEHFGYFTSGVSTTPSYTISIGKNAINVQ